MQERRDNAFAAFLEGSCTPKMVTSEATFQWLMHESITVIVSAPAIRVAAELSDSSAVHAR